MKRFPEATRHLRRLVRRVSTESARTDALISLCDICLVQKDVTGARRTIARFPKPADRREAPALRDFHEAMCLRTERRFSEAIALFLAIRTRHAGLFTWPHIPDICAAQLLCCLGEFKEAHRIVERARSDYPEQPFLRGDAFHDFAFVAHLVEQRYEELSEILLADARRYDDQLSARGQEAVTAGILLELAGKRAEANKVWAETARRFPPDRCYFWGPLARALATGRPDDLETMRLSFQVRSQMFFLAGLLFAHRGQATRSQRLFAASVEEDPSLHWPAHLALGKANGT
jgi:tetratricopeptide (TPR) repeat protein